jgi:hypothetical protein
MEPDNELNNSNYFDELEYGTTGSHQAPDSDNQSNNSDFIDRLQFDTPDSQAQNSDNESNNRNESNFSDFFDRLQYDMPGSQTQDSDNESSNRNESDSSGSYDNFFSPLIPRTKQNESDDLLQDNHMQSSPTAGASHGSPRQDYLDDEAGPNDTLKAVQLFSSQKRLERPTVGSGNTPNGKKTSGAVGLLRTSPATRKNPSVPVRGRVDIQREGRLRTTIRKLKFQIEALKNPGVPMNIKKATLELVRRTKQSGGDSIENMWEDVTSV